MNGVAGRWDVHWGVLSEKFSVTDGDSARAVDSHRILVKLSNLDDVTCLVPFGGVWTCLVLDTDMVANF